MAYGNFGRKFGHVLGVFWELLPDRKQLKDTFKKYFSYNTFKEIHKYTQKGVINGGANSALVLFTVDDYFHAVIKRLPKKAAMTLFVLWMTGCITLNIADLTADDCEKLAKGDLKTFFALCKLCIRPTLSFLNGFNTVGVPVFLFVEVFNFDQLFSDKRYIDFQCFIMALSVLLGLYDAQKSLRVEFQNLRKYFKCPENHNEYQSIDDNKDDDNDKKIDEDISSECKKVCKQCVEISQTILIEIPRIILFNYLDWTALGFYLAFVRKLFNKKLPFESGSKITIPFLLTTAAIIPRASCAITNFFAKKYMKDAKNNSEAPKNLGWIKFMLMASKSLNVSYDILSRFGAVTVIFLVIKHTLEVINSTSYDGTRAAQISELLTMCTAALSMFHEAIDSGLKNYQEYWDDLEKITAQSLSINKV